MFTKMYWWTDSHWLYGRMQRCPFGLQLRDGQCQRPRFGGAEPEPFCSPGLTKCDSQCVNTSSDENNCRSCGTQCNQNQQCINGTCIIPRQCRSCNTYRDCPAGTACYASKCFPAYPISGPLFGACTRAPYDDGCYAGSSGVPPGSPSVCVKSEHSATCTPDCP